MDLYGNRAVYKWLGRMTYYHGTSHGQISQFSFGVRGYGEQQDPLNCIWLSSTFEGAKYHAIQVVGHIRKTSVNYVYEVELPSSYVIADIRYPERLSPSVAAKLVRACLGWRRWIYRHYNWREALAFYIDSRSPKGSNARKNMVFAIIFSAGIDALVAPNFKWHRTGSCSKPYKFNVFDCVGGDAVALLNISSIRLGLITSV